MITPSKACLYGHINLSLALAQQQFSMGLSQSFAPKRGGKTRPWTGFHFLVQKRPVPGSSGPWLRGLTWRVGMGLVQMAKSLLVAMSPPVLPTLGGKGSVGVGTPDVSWSSVSSSSSSVVFRLVCFSIFLSIEKHYI